MLGQRVSELRSAAGWSQVELAKKLSVAKQTISNWENDNIQPSIEMLIRLARLFNVSTDYLLGLDSLQKINVDGLPQNVIAHISLLVNDYKEK